jgi:hypothetical protein
LCLYSELEGGGRAGGTAMAGGALRLRAGERKGGWLEEEGSADGRGPVVGEKERGGERWRWWACRARKVGWAAEKKEREGRMGWAGVGEG